MIKGIIFDLGRVVVHDPDNEIIFQDMADSCRLNYELVAKTVMELIPAYQRGDFTDLTFWQKFAEIAGTTAFVHEDEGNELWSREFSRLLIVDAGILNLVDRLQENGYITPALSNTIPPHVRVLRSRGVLNHFAPQILSCEVGARKPEELVYQLALERSSLLPEETVFIDDVQKYVIAAKEFGIHGILYEGKDNLEEELKSLGVKI